MASRYSNTQSVANKNTKQKYLESTIYPKIKPSNNDVYIISEQGDRLDILAKNYYGDSEMWWIIAIANNINDAVFYIQPGTQLRIPQNVGNIVKEFQKINK